MLHKFPSYIQSEAKDCGPSCLKMIAQYYGKKIDIEHLRVVSETTREGTSLTGLINASDSIGIKAVAIKENFKTLKNDILLPVIAHWNQEHFVVIYKISSKYVYISDPELGKVKYKTSFFLNNWLNTSNDEKQEGILLLLKPKKDFFSKNINSIKKNSSKNFLIKYLKQHRKTFINISLLVLLTSILELAFPFITQKIIDSGVSTKDIPFIYLAAVAYITVFIGYKIAHIIRNWIVIKLSMKFNIQLISDFIVKLTLLPISYYDSKITGDIFQRIGDHDNLEKFFTSNSITALFSILSIIIFSGLFLWYDISIFIIFLLGTSIHITWVSLFFNKRKVLDFKYFSIKSKESNKIIELIHGMQDIKLNGYENQKKEEWEKIRTELYKRDMESMKIEQYQLDGASFINEMKNIGIIILAAILVVNQQMSFGTLLAISYVIGHLSSPVEKLVVFLNNIQDVRLSFRRIMEIHNKNNEGNNNKLSKNFAIDNIIFNNVSFRYSGSSKNTLNNLSFTIPHKKVTAIVGPSGSGKTTLLKLLLKFYETNTGTISLGETPINHLDFDTWRDKFGVVMQEGYIFNDTIANNIIIANKKNDSLLQKSCETANIHNFINDLPLKYDTKIGNEGLDISTGQKQRILMARAIYKNPDFLLFDEATSALDTKNESEITKNLEQLFKNKTVILIAHRLSTVKNADQIIVLSKNGEIVETGTHDELIYLNGYYHGLVKNQLELA